MRLLVIGSGGREHALAWKLAHSSKVSKVYVAPGNGGTAITEKVENLAITDFNKLVEFCQQNKVAFTVVGPDAALADGVVDLFQENDLKIFGPTQAAAKLEWSKDYAKQFMQRHNIPTANYATFTDVVAAHRYIDEQGAPIVIKADGLAAGKGVVVAMNLQQAHAAVDDILQDNRFGQAQAKVVIEQFLEGEEASFFVLTDGQNYITLPTAQDHKRLLDADQGPNTGGMGAYSPAPIISPELRAKIISKIVKPTLKGMCEENNPFVGFLYIGLMIGDDKEPKVVEYNSRLGDPETQVLMLKMKSDLACLIQQALDKQLDEDFVVDWDRRSAITVILAAEGYPDNPVKGAQITGIDASKIIVDDVDLLVFHAGTKWQGDSLLVNGGRVLCVTALGENLKQAKQRAYERIKEIDFYGMQYRTDIGWRALS